MSQINKPIADMTDAEFQGLVGLDYQAYADHAAGYEPSPDEVEIDGDLPFQPDVSWGDR